MGFATRRDFSEYAGRFSYDWIIGNGSRFREFSPVQFLGFAALRNEDRSVESALFEHNFNLTWKSGAYIWTNLNTHYEDLRYALPFPDGTEIPSGSYTYHNIRGGFEMSPTRLFRTNIYLGYGSFFDGWQAEFGVYPTWYASRHFSLSTDYDINIVRFPDRDQGFDAHIVRLRLDGALNNKLSMNGFLQYNSVYDVLTPNARFRYKFGEGNDLWVVFNQTINTDREQESPVLPLTNDRTFLMKYTYTFRM